MTQIKKRVVELPQVTTLSDNDLIVIEQITSNSSSVTSVIKNRDLKKTIIKGPFTSDANANTGGVSIGQLYYLNSGEVRVRLT